MSTNSGGNHDSARQVLSALGDVLVLTEPHQIRLWKSAGLTLVQLRVLRRLREGAASPGELALAAGVSTASMARILGKLEERGLVARSIDPRDRRRIEVTLQPAGSAALSVNRLWQGTAFERAALSLVPADRQRLVEALQGFAQTVQRQLRLLEEAEGAPPERPEPMGASVGEVPR